MLPIYELLQIEERRVLTFREWDDLGPRADPVAKPLACGHAPSYELASLRRTPTGAVVRRERDLCAVVDPGGRHTDPLTGHLRVTGLPVVGRWGPQPSTPRERRLIDEGFAGLLEEGLPPAVVRDVIPWVIGSRVYAPSRARADLDVALELAPTDAVEVCRAAEQMRQHANGITPFRFRLSLASGHLDLFPAWRPAGDHPLSNALRWEPSGATVHIDGVVTDDRFASFAWPTVRVGGVSEWVVVLSNAFRGMLVAGRPIQARATVVEVQRDDRRTVDRVVMVDDPWSNLRTPAFSG